MGLSFHVRLRLRLVVGGERTHTIGGFQRCLSLIVNETKSCGGFMREGSGNVTDGVLFSFSRGRAVVVV